MRILCFLAALLASLLVGFTNSGPAYSDTSKAVELKAVGEVGHAATEADKAVAKTNKAVADANNFWACDLYGQLSQDEGNLFFSPLSISTALAMTYAGAHGRTAAEFEKTLHFSFKGTELHRSLASFMRHLRSLESDGRIQLSVANSLWPAKGAELLPNYLEIINKYYEASITELDFAQEGEAAKQTVNQWVEEHTHGKIKNLLGGPLPRDLKLLLVNAVYFKGRWLKEFEAGQTVDGDFFTASGAVKTPFMSQTAWFRYGQNSQDKVEVLELPYGEYTLSMLILLPQDQTEGALGNLEKALTPERLAAWRAELKEYRQVKVELPKFKITWGVTDLSAALKNLGLRMAFSNEADFSGLSANESLNLDQVLHKAFVEVNEEGTEAAAATAAVMLDAGIPQPPLIFKADRPFIFLIQDKETGGILFMGRLTDPSKAQ